MISQKTIARQRRIAQCGSIIRQAVRMSKIERAYLYRQSRRGKKSRIHCMPKKRCTSVREYTLLAQDTAVS